jgi:hypothetical protein
MAKQMFPTAEAKADQFPISTDMMSVFEKS